MRHVNTETLMTTDNVHTDEDKRLSPLQLGLLTVGLLTTAVGQSFIFAILPPLGREVNLTVLQINSIIASSALVFSAAATVWGRLCDQIGRKPVILIGLTGYAVGNFVFAMIFDAAMRGWLAGPLLFGLILLGRCSQAVVMSGTNPGAAAYAADFSSREHRTKALARLGTASSLGMIIGPIVAGALAGFGLLFPLYTASGLAALAAIVIALKLPPGEIREAKSRTNKRLRFVDPRLRLYLLCSFGGFTGFAGLQQTLGFRLQDMLSLSGTETAQYTGFPPSRYAIPKRHRDRAVHRIRSYGRRTFFLRHAALCRLPFSRPTDHTHTRWRSAATPRGFSYRYPRFFRSGLSRHGIFGGRPRSRCSSNCRLSLPGRVS